MVGVEPLADFGEFGEEEEVEKVNVKGAHPNVLESSSDTGLSREEVLVMTEIHDDNEHERVHGEGLGK